MLTNPPDAEPAPYEPTPESRERDAAQVAAMIDDLARMIGHVRNGNFFFAGTWHARANLRVLDIRDRVLSKRADELCDAAMRACYRAEWARKPAHEKAPKL